MEERNPPKIPKYPGFLSSGDGLFFTLQGEGPTIGLPAVFLRLHLCNLKCDWAAVGGEMCDAWYTWKTDTTEFWEEHYVLLFSEVLQFMQHHNCRRIVITGGEPLLQQHHIVKFVESLPGDYIVEIETNGTIVLDTRLQQFPHVQINCSPKLSNSGNIYKKALVASALTSIDDFYNSNFKFVVLNVQDLQEVAEVVETFDISRKKVIIMPEGTSVEVLSKRMQELADKVKLLGFRLLPRLQFFLYGNKRRT